MEKRKIHRAMAWLSLGATALTVLMRVWLMPTLRDTDTGLFASGTVVVVLLLLVLAVLAGMAFVSRDSRLHIPASHSKWAAVAALLSGGLLLVSGLWDIWAYMSTGVAPVPEAASDSVVGQVLLILQLLTGVLSGGALLHFGLATVSEGCVRPGAVGWGMLAPVLWMWIRLARYEMSYVSAVRLSQGFFDVMMFVLELLFLFYFSRYMAGVGKPAGGLIRFLASAAAVFALSAPLMRIGLYLLGDGDAFRATQLPGLPDVAVGLLALVTVFAASAEEDYSDEEELEELSALEEPESASLEADSAE